MNIRKEIWKLALPVMFVATLNTLFTIVDLWFVARLGKVQTAGVAVASSIYGVTMVISALVSSGTGAIASRSVGAANEEEFRKVSGQSIIYSAIFGIMIYIIAVLTRTTFLGKFHISKEAYSYGLDYMNIIYITIPLGFLLSVLVSILHSKGNTKTPMWIMAISNLMNIFFDWFFIMKLGYGIKGAAAATLLGEVFAVVALFIVVLKLLKTDFLGYMRGIKLEYSILNRILRIGIYTVFYSITRPLTGMVMYDVAAKTGESALVAFNIGGRIFSVLFIFFGGLEVAISILVGQNLGSKNIDKIDKLIKEGLKIAFICVLVLAIPYVIFSKYLMLVFMKDAAVVSIGMRYLRIVYIGIIFLVFVTTYNAVLKGAGDTKPSMIAALIANWIVKIPLAYILTAYGLGADGVWIAIAASVFIEFVIVTYFFAKGTWKQKEV